MALVGGCAPNRTVTILAADNTIVDPDGAGVLLSQFENPDVVGGYEYDPAAAKVTYATDKRVTYDPLGVAAGLRGSERPVFEEVYNPGTDQFVAPGISLPMGGALRELALVTRAGLPAGAGTASAPNNLMNSGGVATDPLLTPNQCFRVRCVAARWLVKLGRLTAAQGAVVCAE